MTKNQNSKKFDLEDRTYQFTKRCSNFFYKLPKTISNFEYGKQLVRASASVAANYIEANESLSKKDFIHRAKICRKEVKESRLWLRLFETGNIQQLQQEQNKLIQEATELMKIFGSILEKCK